MKVIRIEGKAGAGKSWTLDAIKQKAESESKLVILVSADVWASARTWKDTVTAVARQLATDPSATSVVLTDEVPATAEQAVIDSLREAVPTLDYLIIAVTA